MDNERTYVQIGSVLKPHGVRGEFLLYLESDFPEWVASRKQFYAEVDGQMVLWQVERSRFHQGSLILKVDGLKDRTAVEEARKTSLHVLEEEAREVAQDPDYFLNSDLVGLTMMEGDTVLGEIVQVVENPAHEIFEVRAEDGELFLVPFTREIVHAVDLENRQIQVSLPEGLRDLNK